MRDESVGYYCIGFLLLHVRMLGVESAMLVLLPRMVSFTAFFSFFSFLGPGIRDRLTDAYWETQIVRAEIQSVLS